MTNHVVSIVDFAFNPKTINVGLGDTITWSNDGSVDHSAARDDAPAFDTGLISPGGQSAAVVFKVAGSWAYFCRPHMGHMRATIVVT
jgi:plastocyanin